MTSQSPKTGLNDLFKGCKIYSSDTQSEFASVNLEVFHFLYDRIATIPDLHLMYDDAIIEFVTKDNFTHAKLDDLLNHLRIPEKGTKLLIKKSQTDLFYKTISSVRTSLIERYKRKNRSAPKEFLDLYASLCEASQRLSSDPLSNDINSLMDKTSSDFNSAGFRYGIILKTLNNLIAQEPYLYDHSVCVSVICSAIGTHCVKLPSNEQIDVTKGGILHDVGKSHIPLNIMYKPSKFTPKEYVVMKEHTTLGGDKLHRSAKNGIQISSSVIAMAMQHHERFDGTGYPNQKTGRFEDDTDKGIHIFARINAIADVYSAMLVRKTYKSAHTPKLALKIMKSNSTFDYDPLIFDNFLKKTEECGAI